MNHIYRMIWSSSRGAFVAVSEVATSRTKAAGSGLVAGALVLGASAVMAQGVPSNALPTGGQVTAGQAVIQSQGSTMNIVQDSQRAAINWQSFHVGSGASVNFLQPNAQAITLNRVVGNERAVIDGALNANGQVWILSAKGVLFNRGAQVNTGGLLATTMNISDEDFMAGRSTFQRNGSTGSVINLGTIKAADGGYVALLGQQVANEGVITARLGTAVMAAGDQISLNFNGSSLVGVTVDRGVLDALVTNKQAIVADGGLVVLTARGLDEVMSTVVNNTGEIRAQTIGEKEGRIYLLGTGAQDRVAVAGKLDASAPVSGNGGFVETSAARVSFDPNVQITTRSAQGRHGTWLIDPNDFTIAATGGDITGATLAANLANNNVLIESVNGGTSGNGDIFVNDDILKTSGGDTTLTLKAERSITIDQGKTISSTSGKLGLYLSADNNAAHNGTITVGQGVTVRTNGGDVVMGGALLGGLPANDHQVSITFLGDNSGAAPTTVDAGAGDVKLYGNQLSMGAYTSIKGRNLLAEVNGLDFNGNAGVQFTAQEDLTFRAQNSMSLLGTYQIPNGYNDITPASQTFVSAGSSMLLQSGQGLSADSLVVRLTKTGVDNTLTIRTGDDFSFGNSSASFAGTAHLNLLLNQNHTQSEVGGINSAYTDLQGYLTGESKSIYDFAIGQRILRVDGSHFGLKGGSYRLGVYSDAAVQTVSPKAIDNGLLAMGTGLEDSINAQGNLRQPFYFDSQLNQWFKLTYSNYAMDMALGTGGTGTSGWNNAGTLLSDGGFSQALSGLSIDTSGLSGGVGVVRVSYDITVPNNGGTIRMSQAYSLGTGDSFIKNVTTTTNVGATTLDNTRLWVGTRDDYVATTDTNYKSKGNLTANGFETISDPNQQARSIVISQYDPSSGSPAGSAVLFHSTNVDADTATAGYGGFSNIVNRDPHSSQPVMQNDGSYGIYMNYGNMAAGESRTVTWYYGATRLSELNTLVNQVNNAGGLEIVTAMPVPKTPINTGTKVPESVIANAVNPTVVPPVLPTSGERLMGASTTRVGNVVNLPGGVDIRLGSSEQLLLTASLDGDVPNQPVTLSQAREMLGGSPQGGGQAGGASSSAGGTGGSGSGGAQGSAGAGTASAGAEGGARSGDGGSSGSGASGASSASGTGGSAGQSAGGDAAGSGASSSASGGAGQGGANSKEDGTGEEAVRIPAGRNSRVLIVNGGVRLPSGVDQQLFVVRK